MVLATRDLPGVDWVDWGWLVVWTLVGGTLAAGSANAINQYLDRDIDLLMTRTRRRPLPAQSVEPEQAVVFGIVLGVISIAMLAYFVNLVAAFLTLLAIAFYVFVYTMILKRTSTQNIVIGGAAGALPPVIGWAAVTGRVEVPALLLFAIVFYWTPPHFWALSLRIAKDYAAAGVPMLPVVRGTAETTRQILLYTILLVAISLIFFAVARMGLIYLVAAVVMGAIFLWQAAKLNRTVTVEGTTAGAIRLYKFSISYLTVLFAAVAIDALVLIRIVAGRRREPIHRTVRARTREVGRAGAGARRGDRRVAVPPERVERAGGGTPCGTPASGRLGRDDKEAPALAERRRWRPTRAAAAGRCAFERRSASRSGPLAAPVAG